MSRTVPSWTVIAKTPTGAVAYRDTVQCYSQATAIETAKRREDGDLAAKLWPVLTWEATPKEYRKP